MVRLSVVVGGMMLVDGRIWLCRRVVRLSGKIWLCGRVVGLSGRYWLCGRVVGLSGLNVRSGWLLEEYFHGLRSVDTGELSRA